MSLPDLVPSRTAVLLVDLMPRIVALPTAPYDGPGVLSRALRLADALRAAGGTVVHIRAERPNVAEQPPGSELATDPRPGDLVVVKNSWGAFGRTNLDAELRARSVDTVVLTGIATTFGVESTARAADDLGYRTVFAEDAMTGLDAESHAFSVGQVFPMLGEVTTVEAVCQAVALAI